MPKFHVELSWTETSHYRVRRTIEAESQEEAERFVSDNRYDYANTINSETDYDSDDYDTSHADDCDCEECDGEEIACKNKRALPQWF